MLLGTADLIAMRQHRGCLPRPDPECLIVRDTKTDRVCQHGTDCVLMGSRAGLGKEACDVHNCSACARMCSSWRSWPLSGQPSTPGVSVRRSNARASEPCPLDASAAAMKCAA